MGGQNLELGGRFSGREKRIERSKANKKLVVLGKVLKEKQRGFWLKREAKNKRMEKC